MSRIDISIPNNSIILEWIQKSDSEKIKIVKLGIAMYNRGKDEIRGFNNDEYQKNLENYKKRYDEKIVKLNDTIQMERNTKEQLIKNHSSQLNSLQNQIEQQTKFLYEKKIQDLEYELVNKNKIINEKTEKLNSIVSENYNKIFEKINEKDKEWMKRLKDKEDFYEKKLDDERKKTEKQLLRKENSSFIGQDGENLLLEQLNLLCPSAQIKCTTGVPHRGDFVIDIDTTIIMIENKNYTKNVPKVEITKFYNDIKSNSDFNGGILCSQKSGICAKSDYALEIIDSKPIMMLYNTGKEPIKIKLAIDLLKAYIKNESIKFDNKETLDLLKSFSPTLRKSFAKIDKLINSFSKNIKAEVLKTQAITNEIFSILKIKR
tara:strand:+ start:1475 stop:2599 length:1125 start_codon:yes stop_codon:yes gene_type:complete